MKLGTILLLLIFVAAAVFCSGTQENSEVTVFAAASTTDLIESAAEVFTEKYGIIIRLNAASSGTLARQIEQGASPDIYISASGKWMSYVEDLGSISSGSVLMGNSLVLIAPLDSALIPFEITEDSPVPDFGGRISIADPDHAPAGRYAVEALRSCGWYDTLESRIQPAADVRSALAVVEFGETELGIVYKTDAVISSKVAILSIFPENTHSPIEYYCGLLTDASAAAKKFYIFLTEDEDAAAIIKESGFSK